MWRKKEILHMIYLAKKHNIKTPSLVMFLSNEVVTHSAIHEMNTIYSIIMKKHANR